jgi:hypothetical protein
MPPQPTFIDASFLLDLFGIAVDPTEPGAEVRRLAANRKWLEFRSARLEDDPNLQWYWSPAVCRELAHSIAWAFLNREDLHDAYGLGPSIHAHRNEYQDDPSAIPPLLIAQIIAQFRPHLKKFGTQLGNTPDTWSATHPRDQTYIELWDMLTWGNLDPEACGMVIAAMNSGAEALLTRSVHFTQSSGIIRERCGIEVLSY